MCKYHPIIPKPSAYKNSYIAINKHHLCIYAFADLRERQTGGKCEEGTLCAEPQRVNLNQRPTLAPEHIM